MSDFQKGYLTGITVLLLIYILIEILQKGA